jgi:hypothetical protein
MADNTDEEYLENTINNQSESPPDEITPTADTETMNPNQETENMEVHHHAHDPAEPHHKKNWKSYFWEFLMLFLAVFCGFLAEYQLEHVIEHDREKQYIENLLLDLKKDSISIEQNMKTREGRKNSAGSFIQELDPAVTNEKLDKIYYNANGLSSLQIFNYSNATIQQLKYSGLMRLIRKPNVVNSINAYDLLVTRHKVREEVEISITLEFQKAICAVLDANTIKSMGDLINKLSFNKNAEQGLVKPVFRPLITTDPDKINLAKGLAAQLYNRNLSNYSWLVIFKKEVAKTIALIKKEYHLE